MEARTFNKFRQLVYEKSGITLGPGKETLVSARVGKRMRALSMDDHGAYLRHVLDDPTGGELVHLIDAISTNVTSFFRESNHFDLVGRLLSEWIAQGQRRFRFWCAASSTGEEPYSLAITLLETMAPSQGRLGHQDVEVKILATDISTRVLEKCRCGQYGQDKLQTMPPTLRDRYFDRVRESQEPRYVAKPVLKKLITFSRINLATPPFPMQGPFDVVFCRNVMIYFDNAIRSNLIHDIYRLLKPGGYLLVGHAESLTGMMSDFQIVQPSTYVKE